MDKQKVLVTAGASGIGREIVRGFTNSGAKVFVIDVDANGLSTLAAESPTIETAVCDMGSRADIERVVPHAIRAMGGLDVLVNNAGISGPTASVEDYDPDAWEAVMQINLNGNFNVSRLAIAHLKRSQAGSIIMMSSVAGRFGYPNRSAYSVSKWGLIGLTKTLSRDLGEFGVRVNAILPGAVAGDRIERVLAGRAQVSGRSVHEERYDAMSIQSLQRFVDPKDIAALAVFLASDSGKSISGQMLPIDNDMQKAS
ncbi:SDR family oxidoreductase [Paraburkholderia sp. USG1]|uniref:SDR family oxidoreductase n=1 Tax=Paraburkholderia sp. USG1 TaxID=2952268 RepID=UPI002856BA74|nr:SDR family oxidoreductase [Paraburkholderia sp. USG1]MDR8396563.1 SDR family oxidoreductase [Paraburkholderia sp. USG1]